jgi:hypothetical protein
MSNRALVPGVSDSPPVGSRNTRFSRFTSDRSGNSRLKRHVDEVTDDTIAFVSANRITDTGSRLNRFEKNATLEVEGSDLEDGQYQVDENISAAILQLATIGISSDIAGPTVTLRTKNNRNRHRYHSNVS